MITRKGLHALADGIGDAARATGADAMALAGPIIGALRAAGVVTPGFDPDRFARAVAEAAPCGFVPTGKAQ